MENCLMSEQGCIFCKIVTGSLPADIVYQDNDVLAFRDINPVAPTHILIIPKQHLSTANEFSDENQVLIGKLMLTAAKLARELDFAENGYRLAMNCNRDAGQTVYHIHLHLLAGRHFTWPPG
jgi:histidine triad (HIT) family protein